MAFSSQAREYALAALAERRLQSSIASDERKSRIYAAVPELEHIQQDISALAIKALETALADGQNAKTDSFKSQMSALENRQKELLAANGYAPDSLGVRYRCAVCSDTGVKPDGSVCECYKKLASEYSQREINRLSPLSLCSFDTFSLNYYSNDVNAEYGVSPRDNARKNLNFCVGFARSLPQSSRNLLMLGDAGLGKTHLALSIANEALRAGCSVVYCSAAGILRQIESEHFDRTSAENTLENLKSCQLLVLDDLGAEFVTPFVVSALYDLINSRINARRPTVYTTNLLDEQALTRRYTEKICSRLIGTSEILPFFGDDIRLIKQREQ